MTYIAAVKNLYGEYSNIARGNDDFDRYREVVDAMEADSGALSESTNAVDIPKWNSRTIEYTTLLVAARNAILRLRSYVPILIDACEAADKTSARSIADESFAAKSLSVESRILLTGLVDRGFEDISELGAQATFDERILSSIPESEIYADPLPVFMEATDLESIVKSAVRGILERGILPKNDDNELAYLMHYSVATHRVSGLQRLLRTQFAVAISEIQPALTRLFLLVSKTENDVAPKKKSVVELGEEVRKLFIRGPYEWKAQLAETRVFDDHILSEIVDWEELNRMWLRRNLFLHRGALADYRFAQEEFVTQVVGEMVELSIEDVNNAFDFASGVVNAFLMLAARLHFPKDIFDYVVEFERAMILEDLDKQRWWLAEVAARAILSFTSGTTLPDVQVNYWIARGTRLGPDEIRDEVARWNTETFAPVYRLGKHILLDEREKAQVLKDELLKSGDLNETVVRTWPLFSLTEHWRTKENR